MVAEVMQRDVYRPKPTKKQKAEKNKVEIEAVLSKDWPDTHDRDAALRKASAKRHTYALYQFGGKQAHDLTLGKALRMARSAVWPTDEWAIQDEATGEVVIEKKSQLRLVPTKFVEDGNLQYSGVEPGKIGYGYE